MALIRIRKAATVHTHAKKAIHPLPGRPVLAVDDAHSTHPNVDFTRLEREYDGKATLIALSTMEAYYEWNGAMDAGYRLGHGAAHLYQHDKHEYIPAGQDIIGCLAALLPEQQDTETGALRSQVDALKRENRTLKRKNRMLKARCEQLAAATPNPQDWSDDWRERMDLLIRYAWLNMIPASEKPRRPLPGQWEYADTFETMPDTTSSFEVAATCMRILIRLDRDGMMNVHRIKGGKGGTMTHAGKDILRASVADGRHGAPRLHYIRQDDGTILFLDVSNHDEYLK